MIKKKLRLKITSDALVQKGITIHDMHNDKPYRPYDVRCDRFSALGNKVGVTGDEKMRDRACDTYSFWFKDEVLSYKNWTAYEELMRLRELYRKHGQLRIFCCCSPRRCHTETIKTWLEANS